MAGHMGDERDDSEPPGGFDGCGAGFDPIRGAVPGSKGGWVLISDAIKKSLPEEAPFPAGLLSEGAVEEAPAEEAVEDAVAEEAPAEDAAPEATEEIADDAGAAESGDED